MVVMNWSTDTDINKRKTAKSYDIIKHNPHPFMDDLLQIHIYLDMYKDFVYSVSDTLIATKDEKIKQGRFLKQKILGYLNLKQHFAYYLNTPQCLIDPGGYYTAARNKSTPLTLYQGLINFCNDTNLRTNLGEIYSDKENDPKNAYDVYTSLGLMYMGQLQMKIHELLGSHIIYPKVLCNTLFPGYDSDKDFYDTFLNTLQVCICNENQLQRIFNITEISIKYKEKYIDLTSVKAQFKFLITDNIKYTATVLCIDATPGVYYYPDTRKILTLNKDKLITLKTPADELDGAWQAPELKASFVSTFIKGIHYYGNYNEDLFIDINSNPFINAYIPKKDIRGNYNISKLKNIDCPNNLSNPDLSDNQITIRNCWNKIKNLSPRDPFYKEKDICIKSKKSSMDILKCVYVSKYQNDFPDYNIISLYNDRNAAIMMSFINPKIFTVFASDKSIGFDDKKDSERIVLSTEILRGLNLTMEDIEKISEIYYKLEILNYVKRFIDSLPLLPAYYKRSLNYTLHHIYYTPANIWGTLTHYLVINARNFTAIAENMDARAQAARSPLRRRKRDQNFGKRIKNRNHLKSITSEIKYLLTIR
jgi:hypothetical protein